MLTAQQGPLDIVITLVEGNLAGSTSHCYVLYTSYKKRLKSQRLCIGAFYWATQKKC